METVSGHGGCQMSGGFQIGGCSVGASANQECQVIGIRRLQKGLDG